MGQIDSEERERVRVTGRQTGGEGERETHIELWATYVKVVGERKLGEKKKGRKERMEGDQRVFISPREVWNIFLIKCHIKLNLGRIIWH